MRTRSGAHRDGASFRAGRSPPSTQTPGSHFFVILPICVVGHLCVPCITCCRTATATIPGPDCVLPLCSNPTPEPSRVQELQSHFTEVDPAAICSARLHLKRQLADSLSSEFLSQYQQARKACAGDYDLAQSDSRRLSALCLGFLSEASDRDDKLFWELFSSAVVCLARTYTSNSEFPPQSSYTKRNRCRQYDRSQLCAAVSVHDRRTAVAESVGPLRAGVGG